jgi:large subunit ribosomal protein L22
MPYQATHRFARISARKVRQVIDMIRGKYADEALEMLRYQPQRGAKLIEKVLRSAMANAEDRRAADLANLMVIDARVDGGPMFKRIRPRARGMAFTVLRRMAHISVSVGPYSDLPEKTGRRTKLPKSGAPKQKPEQPENGAETSASTTSASQPAATGAK